MDNKDVLINEIAENLIDYALQQETRKFLIKILFSCYDKEEQREIIIASRKKAKEEFEIRYGRKMIY